MSFSIHRLLGLAALGAALLVGMALIAGGDRGLAARLASVAYAEDGIRVPSNVCAWENFDWSELNDAEKRAWGALGWTEKRWESDDSAAYPASAFEDWSELQPFERTAALMLGYTQRSWDADDCP